jgi:hypothetical protein
MPLTNILKANNHFSFWVLSGAFQCGYGTSSGFENFLSFEKLGSVLFKGFKC